MLQKNTQVFWNKKDELITVDCPNCGLPFSNYQQMEVHVSHYCNPHEDLDILRNHFQSLNQRLLKSNYMSLEAKKLLITLKGLSLVKIDWDAQKSFLQTKNAAKNSEAIAESEKGEELKDVISTTDKTSGKNAPSQSSKRREPRSKNTKPSSRDKKATSKDRSNSQEKNDQNNSTKFLPYKIKNESNTFSDINQSNSNATAFQAFNNSNFYKKKAQIFSNNNLLELENIKRYPHLQSVLRGVGTELSKLGYGSEKLDEQQKHYPAWFNSYKKEDRQRKIDDTNLIFGFKKESLQKFSMKDLTGKPRDELFRDPQFNQYYDILNDDANSDMTVDQVRFYLKKKIPANENFDYVEQFRDQNKEPTLKELEPLL